MGSKNETDGAYPVVRPYLTPPAGRRRRTIPDRVERYYLPLSVLEATDRVMRSVGQQNRECYVWWGGYFASNGEAQIVTALWPDVDTDFGCVHLKTPHLVALHEKLRALDEVLLVELHTHPPGAGGQNHVDAANPGATYRGFVTVVVPDFGLPMLYDLRKTHVYEYLGHDEWRGLEPDEIGTRFVIEEGFVPVRP
jgi:hypothetical protein